MLQRQNRRTLSYNFSLQRPAIFTTRLALANGHFCQIHEKLSGRNDAAPEALSAVYAKRIASETIAFAFSSPVDSEDQTAICRLEKLCGRSNRPLHNVNPLSRLLDSKPMKSYSSPK
jgi:hypothetical protein